MGILQLVRIENRKETVLEETPVPDDFVGATCFYSPDHIKELERHYRRTGKPKRSYVDVLYVTRIQVERHHQPSPEA